MAFNSDAYIANLVKQGFSRADAVNSARYEAQAQAYAAPPAPAYNPLSGITSTPSATPYNPLSGITSTPSAPAYNPLSGMTPTPAATPVGKPTYVSDYAAASKAAADAASAAAAIPPNKAAVTPKTSPFDAASDAILANTLKSYGMSGVAATIAQIRADYPEISSENLLLLLKNDNRYNAEYNKRFAGNAKLKAAGLPTLDDSSYLKAEDEYKKIFTAYGATTLATRDYYATLIGNRMDAVDVTNRMNDAYALLKASPWVMNAFKEYYSAITDGDVLALILDEKTQLPILNQKVQAAQIGGAALAQGLKTSLATAQDLQASNVTVAQAQAGYSTIAQGMTDYEKILEINAGKDIKTADVQAKLEASRLKKTASAIKEEQAAIGMEAARFGGSAGRLASKDRATGLI
jgi:hypothetical protein